MKEAVLQLLKKYIKEGNTFKITTKRADKMYPMDTNELNQHLVRMFYKMFQI